MDGRILWTWNAFVLLCFFFSSVFSVVSVLSRRSCWLDFVAVADDDTEYERFFFSLSFLFRFGLPFAQLFPFTNRPPHPHPLSLSLCVSLYRSLLVVYAFTIEMENLSFAPSSTASICSISKAHCALDMNFNILRTIYSVGFHIDFCAISQSSQAKCLPVFHWSPISVPS